MLTNNHNYYYHTVTSKHTNLDQRHIGVVVSLGTLVGKVLSLNVESVRFSHLWCI
jgi:hypothetical protein